MSAANQYINTTYGVNGDGSASTLAASTGAAGAYNNWASWVGQNLTLTQAMVLHFVGSITSNITMSGWTTTSSFNLTIDGLNFNSGDYGSGFTIDQNNVILQNSTIGKTSAGYQRITALAVTSNAIVFTLKNCTIFYSGHKDSGNAIIEIADVTAGVKNIRNCVVYAVCSESSVNGIQHNLNTSETVNLYNNTVVSCSGAGIAIDLAVTPTGTTLNATNNLCSSNGTDVSFITTGATFNHATNASSDSSSPDSSFRLISPSYTNSGTHDYSLTTSVGTGTDLSGTFTDDRAGTTRSVPWDIGAYEVATVAGLYKFRKLFGGGMDDYTGGVG